MRLSLIALIPLTAFLSVVHAHTHEAREHIDELATRAFKTSLLTTRQDLADLSTRDLLNELEDRLQRRADRYYCKTCFKYFYKKEKAEAHGENLGHKAWARAKNKNKSPIPWPLP
ncbi:hypothetical protein DFP72DRAFT_1153484 [Ephemerocybe angulata]|uniref:C2H2-type domain-containing protein n=1 Tax=Ephemerocybe angulata TaxID=980116 RepID=A0A8H6HGG9_9AGAR|nr:hypothetical protein DFP72DRAFT_1153484 [Tulosesus angulatus]